MSQPNVYGNGYQQPGRFGKVPLTVYDDNGWEKEPMFEKFDPGAQRAFHNAVEIALQTRAKTVRVEHVRAGAVADPMTMVGGSIHTSPNLDKRLKTLDDGEPVTRERLVEAMY